MQTFERAKQAAPGEDDLLQVERVLTGDWRAFEPLARRQPKRNSAGADRSSIQPYEGDKLFGTECGACHGLNGHTPADAGRWMYPRAADLTSTDVQRYSDRKLFWIVKNGIRLSGMPAFAKVESDEHIWDLVLYLRTLPNTSRKKAGNAKMIVGN